jgi:predicted porin
MNGGLLKVAGHGAIAALAGVLLNAGSAQAADLGGNCCADLEERVAELEATTVRKGNRRVSLTISGQVNRSVMYWNDDFASDIYSVDNAISNSRFRFTGNAKINADLTAGFHMEFDLAIGARSHQVNQIDDDGFTGGGGILGSPVFGDGIGGNGDSVLSFNQAYWYITSKHWGRLSVGRLSTATSGISIIDLSNTGVAANSQPFAWGAGFFLRAGNGALASTTWGQFCGGPTPGVFTDSNDAFFFGGAGPYATDCGLHALSRRDAVMYTTPTWHGFTFGTAWGEDDFWDVAMRYAGEHHGFRVAAGIGYRRYDDREPDLLVSPVVGYPDFRLDDTERRHFLSSASVMHTATGLFVSVAYLRYVFHGGNQQEVFDQDPDRHRPDVDLWWVDAGIQRNWTGWGNTTFYAEYGRVYDGLTGLTSLPLNGNEFVGTSGLQPTGAEGVVADSEYWWWGLGAVQTIDAAAMDLYIGFRRYQGSITMGDSDALPGGVLAKQIPGGIEDIWFIQAGARIQF